MKIRGILFDKDGTLFDFHQTWVVWFDLVISELSGGDAALKLKLAESCGFDLPEQRFVAGSLIVIATAQEVNNALMACLPAISEAEIDAVARKHLANLPHFPVCDLRPLLELLRTRGFILGLATNDYVEGAEVQLQEAGVRDLFDFICGYDSGFGAKPGPGMIKGFCAKTGLRPAEVAVVGDSVHDLEAGQAAQVALNIGVLTGPATISELHPASDVVLADISGIPELLAG